MRVHVRELCQAEIILLFSCVQTPTHEHTPGMLWNVSRLPLRMYIRIDKESSQKHTLED